MSIIKESVEMVSARDLALVAIFFVSCGPSQTEPSLVKYQEWSNQGRAFSGLYSNIKICIKGPNAGRWNVPSFDALAKWIKPLQSLDPEIIPSFSIDCRNPDYEIKVNSTSGRANASTVGKINLYQNSTFNTLSHEFGHVFANLADTYIEGAWTCKPGQPVSVMCNAQFSDLKSDDINGVVSTFKKHGSLERPKIVFSRILRRLAAEKHCRSVENLNAKSSTSITFKDGLPDRSFVYLDSEFGILTLESAYLARLDSIYQTQKSAIWNYLNETCPDQLI